MLTTSAPGLRRAAPLLRLHPRRLALAAEIAAVEPAGTQRALVRVDGMVRAGCAARTAVALRRVPGVHEVTVDLDASTAELQYETDRPPPVGQLQSALHRVVVGAPERRLLARWAGRRARAGQAARE